jgi:hypothetical protein
MELGSSKKDFRALPSDAVDVCGVLLTALSALRH